MNEENCEADGKEARLPQGNDHNSILDVSGDPKELQIDFSGKRKQLQVDDQSESNASVA